MHGVVTARWKVPVYRAVADEDGYRGYQAFLKKIGFRILTRTLRGLARRAQV
jgi:hypothetical protein